MDTQHRRIVRNSLVCSARYGVVALALVATTLLPRLMLDLYNGHADLVLNGHDHIYERFAPQDPSGNADPANGLTEIIVGTGGKDHGSFSATADNSVVRDNTTYGVLKLTLHSSSFAWQFLPEMAGGNGTFTDSGSQACHEDRGSMGTTPSCVPA
jgi:hypothetical protein